MGRPQSDLAYTGYYPEIVSVTIADGATTSGEIDLDGLVPVGVFIGADLDGVALTFTASTTSGGTFVPVYKDGAAYSEAVGTSRYIPLSYATFLGIRYLKLVAGVAQTGATTLSLVVRAI